MQDADDPPRLLDELGDASGELRLGLERFSRELPGPERLARLAAALGVDPSPPPEPTSPPGKSLAGKLALGGGGVGVAALALWVAMHRPPTAATGARPLPATAVSQATGSAPFAGARPRATEGSLERGGQLALGSESAVAPSPIEPTADAAAAESPNGEKPSAERSSSPGRKNAAELGAPAAAPARGVSSAPRAPSSAPASAAAPPPSETELLRDARLVLEREPNQALALSEQHRRAYPNGAFSQERELIAITALVKLGRTAEARSRAERFRQSYPRSAYAERLDRLVSP